MKDYYNYWEHYIETKNMKEIVEVRHGAFTSAFFRGRRRRRNRLMHARGGQFPGNPAFSRGQHHDSGCAPLSASVPGSPTAPREAALQFYSFARIVFRTRG